MRRQLYISLAKLRIIRIQRFDSQTGGKIKCTNVTNESDNTDKVWWEMFQQC